MIESLLTLFGLLPITLRSAIGEAIGWFISYVPHRERKVALLQIEMTLPKQNHRAILHKVYQSLGSTMAEIVNIAPIMKSLRAHVDGPPDLFFKQLADDARPVVFLSAHLSNWDLLAPFASVSGLSMVTIGREARNKSLHRALAKIRESYGVTTIWRGDVAALRKLVSAFKEKKAIGALIDQDTQVENISSPFLGHEAATPVAIVRAGKRYNARFYSAFMVRTAPLQYKIVLDELVSSHSEEDIIAQYHHNLERVIKAFPEQWVWIHKRWRTLPTGERLSTQRYIAWLKKTISSNSLRVLMRSIILSLSLAAMSSNWLGCAGHTEPSLPQKAEELTRQGEYDQAIALYHNHIADRLARNDRAPWENPYFYLLAIGDIEVHRGRYQEALLVFEEAEREGVDTVLISDRYRYVARKYEQEGKYDQALEVLTKYNDRDPLLFDLIRDRIGKTLLTQQESVTAVPAHPSGAQ